MDLILKYSQSVLVSVEGAMDTKADMQVLGSAMKLVSQISDCETASNVKLLSY